MRIYTNASEMYEETKRDLKEMGIVVKPKTMQDKVIEGKEEFETYELQNYSYCLLNADPEQVSRDMPVNKEWADAEFEERTFDPWIPEDNGHGVIYPIEPLFINPGQAYLLRKDVWKEYMHNGKMAYTYNERLWMNDQTRKALRRIKEDHGSRQIWISIWDPTRDVDELGGISRVPCSLGYSLQVRNDRLNLHYVMRSCDFITHFSNDVYLAIKFMHWAAKKIEVEPGDFTHTIFSLHVYKKDVQEVF